MQLLQQPGASQFLTQVLKFAPKSEADGEEADGGESDSDVGEVDSDDEDDSDPEVEFATSVSATNTVEKIPTVSPANFDFDLEEDRRKCFPSCEGQLSDNSKFSPVSSSSSVGPTPVVELVDTVDPKTFYKAVEPRKDSLLYPEKRLRKLIKKLFPDMSAMLPALHPKINKKVTEDPLLAVQRQQLKWAARGSFRVFELLRRVANADSDAEVRRSLNSAIFATALEMSRARIGLINLGRKSMSVEPLSSNEGNVIRDFKTEEKVQKQEKQFDLLKALSSVSRGSRLPNRDKPPSASKATQQQKSQKKQGRGGAPGHPKGKGGGPRGSN